MRCLLPALLLIALAGLGAGQSQAPVVYKSPEGAVIPKYFYQDAKGKLPFYGEYYSQSGDGNSRWYDNPQRWYQNLEVIVPYSTLYMVILRKDDPAHIASYANLARAAVERGQLLCLASYGKDGVDRVGHLLDLLETQPHGQRVIRNTVCVKLMDEPYLGGQSPKELEELVAYFDSQLKARYPHLLSLINFAVSNQDVKTWGTGEDGRKRLPRGLGIVSLDIYTYLGNGKVWGSPDPGEAERIALDWMELMFRDESFEWNQTRLLREAIDAVYTRQERPMMWLIGNSGYVQGITFPTPVSIQDKYFDICRQKDWSGLIWWQYEDFKDCRGGHAIDTIDCHKRHGELIRSLKLY